jgi:hypothetical protein
MKKLILSISIGLMIFSFCQFAFADKTIKNPFVDHRQKISNLLSDFKVSIPSTISTPCTEGQISYNSTHFYICTATDTWRRTAISTWATIGSLLLESGDFILLETGDQILLE